MPRPLNGTRRSTPAIMWLNTVTSGDSKALTTDGGRSSGPLTVSVHITCTRPPSLRASSSMMSDTAGSVMPFSFRISTSSPAFISQPPSSRLRAPRRTSSSL